MAKKAILFFGFFLMVSSFAYAEKKYTISGEVTFQYDGNIYICLFTHEKLRDFVRPHHSLSKSICKVVKMNADLKKAGKVSLTFDNIPKGTYCVLTYQDVNMNGEVDYEGCQMAEPFGTFKEIVTGTGPKWQEIKFDLEGDITGIKIEM